MATSYPKVLVSILNWNNIQNTKNCIESLAVCSYKNKEIVVVDNNSTESIEQLTACYPQIKIFRNPKNLGYAYGHKTSVAYGLKEGYDLLWILNNDLIVYEFTLLELVKYYVDNGPKLILGSQSDDAAFDQGIWKTKNQPIPWVDGFSIMIPFKVIEDFGFMHDKFFMYGEEVDYCIRMYEFGIISKTIKSSKVKHFGTGSSENNKKLSLVLSYYRLRNYLELEKKHGKSYRRRISYLLISHIRSFLGLEKYSFDINRYTLLAITHSLLSIKGKTLIPEKYISQTELMV